MSLSATSKWILNAIRDGESTSSPGSLSVTLSVKKFFSDIQPKHEFMSVGGLCQPSHSFWEASNWQNKKFLVAQLGFGCQIACFCCCLVFSQVSCMLVPKLIFSHLPYRCEITIPIMLGQNLTPSHSIAVCSPTFIKKEQSSFCAFQVINFYFLYCALLISLKQ